MPIVVNGKKIWLPKEKKETAGVPQAPPAPAPILAPIPVVPATITAMHSNIPELPITLAATDIPELPITISVASNEGFPFPQEQKKPGKKGK